MPHAERTEISPIIGIYQELRTLQPAWYVEIGRPHGTGWITGTDLRMASAGPFNDLLSHIGDRLHTADRRTIAAAFALRYGWSAGMAIAPYLLGDCVPTITLDNVSFKFGANTLFERVALHHPRPASCCTREVARPTRSSSGSRATRTSYAGSERVWCNKPNPLWTPYTRGHGLRRKACGG
jgi:hypothetical protein